MAPYYGSDSVGIMPSPGVTEFLIDKAEETDQEIALLTNNIMYSSVAKGFKAGYAKWVKKWEDFVAYNKNASPLYAPGDKSTEFKAKLEDFRSMIPVWKKKFELRGGLISTFEKKEAKESSPFQFLKPLVQTKSKTRWAKMGFAVGAIVIGGLVVWGLTRKTGQPSKVVFVKS